MSFKLPKYNCPDFDKEPFTSMPDAKIATVMVKGAAPDHYHATSIYPEYFKIKGKWVLASESRMDCVVVVTPTGTLDIKEFRNLNEGDAVILGREEDGSEGIYMVANPFSYEKETIATKEAAITTEEEVEQSFAFRTGRSRETSFSKDYDDLYDLLKYEKENGYIVWVLGPAVIFDHDSKTALAKLIDNGFVHAIFGGNAVATHDLEGSMLGTALGQHIYTQHRDYNGHYNHIDIINKARRAGSIENFVKEQNITTGIMSACVRNSVPFVLAGSIRDDGPLPGVIASAYEAQDAMRFHCKKATTVICLATMLHTIATGNMTPMFKVEEDKIRPLYIYNVDIAEFAANKLKDRGSLEVTSIITNVQDFVVHIAKSVL